jgi:phospholipase D1/2
MHDAARSGLLIDGRDYFCAFREAARRARRSILLLGWQFDSDVALLRGDDAPAAAKPAELELLPFLDGLCRKNPALEVRILAWDHSVVFALEREILQKLIFGVTACERLRFEFDATVPLGGSHHQKVAIVDGRVAFLGSMDLCQSRWDTSSHVARDERRTSRFGVPYKPYHEVGSVVFGPAARTLLDLFVDRWRTATGEALDGEDLVAGEGDSPPLPLTLAMPPAAVGVSRTMPPSDGREPAYEIRELYARAIRSAERSIYIETQYLTSCLIRDALVTRLHDSGKPPLDVVIILPRKPEKLKEELTVTHPQALLLRAVRDAAQAGGHALGVYNVAAREDGRDVFVYIHSKLMIVDDRFMTLGSANLTNRSMALDTEVNVSWEAGRGDARLRAAIRRARVRLLCEHLGEAADARLVASSRGLVARLSRVAEEGRGRLRVHELDHEEPSMFARKVQELACEVLDPSDGSEPLPPSVRPTAA